VVFTVARRIVVDEWRSARSAPRDRRWTRFRSSRKPIGGRLLDQWIVAEALDRLTAEHRAVIVECYYRGRSTAEARRFLQVPSAR
jgi:RNA polymerase sigma-70 factor (ECF subfamily)